MQISSPSTETAVVHPWAARLRRDISALGLMLALSLAMVAPVLGAPRQQVVGWPGDNLLYTYGVSWMAQAPLIGKSPFVDPRLNFPDDLALTANDFPYLCNLLVAPATWLLGPAFSYNLIVVLSLLGSGYCTYLWALDSALAAGRERWRAALPVAGAAFLVGSASQYYLMICLLIGVPYALLRTLPDLGGLLRRGWPAALGAPIVAELDSVVVVNLRAMP